MAIVPDYYRYAVLSTAAYVRTGGSKDPGDFIREASTTEANRLPLSLGQYFFDANNIYGNLDVWSILHYYGSDNTNDPIAAADTTGFAATLFHSGGDKVLALRGTEPFADDWVDLLQADLGSIGILGMALPQAVSMVNLILRLRADKNDNAVPQLKLKTSLGRESERAVALSGTRQTINEFGDVTLESVTVYIDFAVEYTGTGLQQLNPGERLHVTGHSLGGHLAILAARLFPELIDPQVVVFNSPGFDAQTASGLLVPTSVVLDDLAEGLGGGAADYIDPTAHRLTDELVELMRNTALVPNAASDFSGLQIVSLESEDLAAGDDVSFVSSALTNQQSIGASIDVPTEPNSHVIEPLMDALALHVLLSSLNPSLTLDQMRQLLLAAGERDAVREERLTEALFRLLLPADKFLSGRGAQDQPIHLADRLEISDAIGPWDNRGWIGKGEIGARDAFHDALLRIGQAIGNRGLSLVSLASATYADLLATATGANSVAYRYALKALNPFVLLGDDSLYAPHNANGELDLYDPQTGAGSMTEQYLRDRAAMLSWQIAFGAAHLPYSDEWNTSDLEGDWDYVDLTHQITLAIDGSDVSLSDHQVVFGTSGADQAQGSGDSDYLYGMAGDDVIEGGDERDYLEGGLGNDELQGGQGRDRLYGGTGNDALFGGTDQDDLYGGEGVDRYYVEGGDTISDSDDRGAIYLGSAPGPLTGGSQPDAWRHTGLYRSADGEVIYQEHADGSIEFRGNGTNGHVAAPNTARAGTGQSGKQIISGDPGLGIPLIRDTAPDDPARRPLVHGPYSGARNWQPRRDPLTFDLDGDGIETTAANPTSPILFDHDGDGVKSGTGWIGADDAFLTLDRNGNGLIDNGTELFGDATPLAAGGKAVDGFAALAPEDSNGDGQVDAADARFAQLRLWRDLNQDAVSQSGELFTLEALGVASIGVAKTSNSSVLLDGNRIADLGSFTRSDGSLGTLGEIGMLADVDLVDDTFASEFPDDVPLLADIALLPNLKGSGQVRDLWQAASLSPALAALLDQFVHSASHTEQWALVDPLLDAWSDTSTMLTTATGAFAGHPLNVYFASIQPGSAPHQAWLDKLSVLERFNGRTFAPVPGVPGTPVTIALTQGQLDLLEQSYWSMQSALYGAGVMQTRLAPLTRQLELTQAGDGWGVDFSAVNDALEQTLLADAAGGVDDIGVLLRASGLPALGWNGLDLLEDAVVRFASLPDVQEVLAHHRVEIANGTRNVTHVGEILIGGAGADRLSGDNGANLMHGSHGDDWLTGLAGDDVLAGGAGNDGLYGDGQPIPTSGGTIFQNLPGSDTYLFGRGDGRDTIYDYDAGPGRVDTLQLIDLNADEVRITRERDSLFVQVKGSSDQIEVIGWALGSAHRIERIAFADGSALEGDALQNAPFLGSDAADDLYATAGDDVLDGGSGSDALHGGAKYSSGAGNDVYVFGRGYGHDVVYDDDTTPGNVDAIWLRENVAPTDVTLSRDPRNALGLVLSIDATGDTLTVNNWFAHSRYRVEQVRFADGTLWDASLLAQAPLLGTPAADVIFGQDTADTLRGLAGSDTLYGGGGDDVLDGGGGDDALRGGGQFTYGAGNDVYLFGFGGGRDSVLDNDTTPGNADTIQLADGVRPADATLSRDTRNVLDLVLTLEQTGDRITVVNWFADAQYRVEQVRFADGTVWDAAALSQAAVLGTPDADTLSGQGGDDTLRGRGGMDALYGDGGNDVLDGGVGDDWLQGGGRFTYGAGNDTYVFGLGYGRDVVSDDDITPGNLDTIHFNDDVTPAAVVLSRDPVNSNDLVLRIDNTDDRLTVRNWFADPRYRVEQARFADGTVWDASRLAQAAVQGSADGEAILGQDIADTILGGGGDDILSGRGGDDVLDGGTGDDTLYGGTQTTYGAGNDTYVFGRGYGRDVVFDSDTTPGNLDAVRFHDEVLAADVTLLRDPLDSYNLVLRIDDTGDTLTVRNWFGGDQYRVEQVRFADGTLWDVALQMQAPVAGGAGADTISGGSGDDIIRGLAGDDTLYGREANDVLDGGPGNDVLYGGTQTGSLVGNDTYVFGRGSGRDVVYDTDVSVGNVDTIALQDGVAPGEVALNRDPAQTQDLVLSILGTSDRITVRNWFSGTASRVEQVRFADGTLWDASVLSLALAATGWGPDTLSGSAQDDVLQGLTGDSTLYGLEGNDRLDGGTGNDTLYGGDQAGGAGNDTYVFGRGYGRDAIHDSDGAPDNLDTIELALDILPADVVLARDPASTADLVLAIDGTSDTLAVKGWFTSAANRVEQVRFADGSLWDTAFLAQTPIVGTPGGDSITGLAIDDIVLGHAGDDTLEGGGGHDLLDGGTGNDTLYGGSGSNGAGDDTYVFARGYGRDVVYDTDATPDNLDTIRFAADVAPAEIVVSRDPTSLSDLVLSIEGTSDRVTVKSFFAGEQHRVEQIAFADGTLWDLRTLTDAPVAGSPAADTLHGGAEDDLIQGLAGNDKLYGQGADDSLDGGTGDDALYGGNETSGEGNDTYLFGRRSGKDTVYDLDPTPGNIDTIQLADGITAADVRLSRDGGNRLDLVLSIADTGDTLTVKNWFSGSQHRVEQIAFADGALWDAALLAQAAITGTMDNDSVQGTAGADILTGLGGNDGLSGLGGDDLLDGGEGDDTLYGGDLNSGAGNDTYVFARGYGQDRVRDQDSTPGNVDTIVLRDLLPAQVTLGRDWAATADLVLSVDGTSERITVDRWFTGTDNRVERLLFADGTVWDTAVLAQAEVLGTGNQDIIQGLGAADTIRGLWGNDVLYGMGGNDVLDGGVGDDSLYGGDSSIGTGNDTYIFGRGFGADVVYDTDATAGNLDVILLGDDVLPGDVQLARDSAAVTDLVVSIRGASDTLTVKNWFSGTQSRVEQIRFADGTLWDTALLAQAEVQGTPARDEIHGLAIADTIRGQDGDDVLFGEGGDDVLDGGAGKDTLIGGASGGGAGNDTYIFGPGYGQDSIYDNDATAGNVDTIALTPALRPANVTLSRDPLSVTDLVLAIRNSSDKLTVLNWFSGVNYRVEQVRFADGTLWDAAQLALAPVVGTGGNETITGLTTIGDILQGLGGNDNLSGQAGDDLLDGGTGNDNLNGGTGNDTFVFARGYGQDTVFDQDSTAGNLDTLRLGPGIAPSQVTVGRNQTSGLVLRIEGSSDQVTVTNWFNSTQYRVERVQFDDGTPWDATFLAQLPWIGTAAGEDLNGSTGNDTILALAGDDRIFANSGDDVLDGGAGADRLYGQAGNDTLDGGAGDDLLHGGSNTNDGPGNDTYRFGKGGGRDIVYDRDTTAGNSDTIEMASDVARGEVALTRHVYDLIASIAGTEDRITVSNWFSGTQYRVEQLRFSDGTIWDAGVLAAATLLPIVGTAGRDIFSGTVDADTLIGLDGDDNLSGGPGNDLVLGGSGADVLYGNEGNDRVYGEDGNDMLFGDQGNNLFEGGAGDDTLTAYYSRSLLTGGRGADTLQPYATGIVVAFNAGDGQDTIDASAELTLSLSGIDVTAITAQRDGYDLVLGLGVGDSLRLRNRYAQTPQPALRLQTLSDAVYTYDLNSVIAQFERDHAQSPTGALVAIGAGIESALTSVEFDRAVGGDLAIAYALAGSSIALDADVAQAALADAGFGSGAQLLAQPFAPVNRAPMVAVVDVGRALNERTAAAALFGASDADGDAIVAYELMDATDRAHGAFVEVDGVAQAANQAILVDADRLPLTQFVAGAVAGFDRMQVRAYDGQRWSAWKSFTLTSGDPQAPVVVPTTVWVPLGHEAALADLVSVSDANGDAIAQLQIQDGNASAASATLVVDGIAQPALQTLELSPAQFASAQLHAGSAVSNDQLSVRAFDGQLWSGWTTVSVITTVSSAVLGTSGADDLAGTDAADIVQGLGGNDLLNGLAGNDTLRGGGGDDTYRFDLGAGTDTIVDAEGSNRVVFGAGIRPDMLRLTSLLRIAVGDGSDALNVQGVNYYDPLAGPPIAAYEFEDGSVLTHAQLLARGFDIGGTDSADYLIGTVLSDRIDAGAGDDWLIGDRGDDHLNGGEGSDWYELTAGFGSDELEDTDAEGDDVDNLYLGYGITPEVVTLERSGRDALLTLAGQPDRLTIRWHRASGVGVEQILFYDGTLWDLATLQGMLGPDNLPPVVAAGVADVTVNEDALLQFSVGENAFSDPDPGDALSYTARLANDDPLPQWLAFDTTTGTFSGTPSNQDVGDLHVRVLASDGAGESASDEFVLTIANTNDAPVASGALTEQIAPEAALFQLNVPATLFDDPDVGDTLTLAAVDLPAWLTFDAQAQRFSGTPGYEDAGSTLVSLIARDVAGATAGTAFLVTVPRSAGVQLAGTPQPDVLSGKSGDDTITGAAGNDKLLGGGGDDTLDGGPGADAVHGGSGDDLLKLSPDGTWGSGYGARNAGSPGVAGTGETVSIAGKTQNHDKHAGGPGIDTLAGTGSGDAIFLDDSFSPTYDGIGPRLADIEIIRAGAGDDIVDLTSTQFGYGNVTVHGDDGADILWTSGGNDRLLGGNGNDRLHAGAGEDWLDGGTGADSMKGGAGNDTYLVDNTGDVVSESAAQGIDTVVSSVAQFTLPTNVENLALDAPAAVTGVGNALDNVVAGNGADNRLLGLGGNDLLRGGAGKDTLYGDAGADVLEGGEGDDTLGDAGGNGLYSGGAGNDSLSGAAGNELFAGGAGNDAVATGSGSDLVAHNHGDGQDQVAMGSTRLTLSLGGGIAYEDLALRKSGNDLVLETGNEQSVTLDEWYAATTRPQFLTLQTITAAMDAFDAASADPLRNAKVQQFDLNRLVQAYDQALAGDPTLDRWALMHALLDARLAASDGEALGGDLAYQYGMSGGFTGIGLGAAQQVLASTQFGSQAQPLRPLAELQQGPVRLG